MTAEEASIATREEEGVQGDASEESESSEEPQEDREDLQSTEDADAGDMQEGQAGLALQNLTEAGLIKSSASDQQAEPAGREKGSIRMRK